MGPPGRVVTTPNQLRLLKSFGIVQGDQSGYIDCMRHVLSDDD